MLKFRKKNVHLRVDNYSEYVIIPALGVIHYSISVRIANYNLPPEVP